MSTEEDPLGIDEIKKGLDEKEAKAAAMENFFTWLRERGNEPLRADEKPKPIEWLCEGYFTRRSSALLSGKPKSGKSALSLDIAIGAASGTGAVRTEGGGWLFDFAGKPIRTYYLDTENNRSLVLRRLRSLCEEKEVKSDNLLMSRNLILDPLESEKEPPFLAKEKAKPDLKADIQAAKDFGQMLRQIEVQFVVLDVMSHCYQEDALQRDELNQGFMKDFFRIINAIVSESGACVLLVHHIKKGKGKGAEMGSGSSQMLRTPELLLTLTSEENDSEIFCLEKQGRQIRKPGEVYLQASSTKDENCRLFTQVSKPEKRSRGRPTGDKLGKAREVLGEMIKHLPRERLSNPFGSSDWNEMAGKVSSASDKTLRGYLVKLLEEGDLQTVSTGLYKLREPEAD
jgi:hypothetical protein